MPNPLSALRPDPLLRSAHALYAALVTQARRPEFYTQWQVPDTLDGRFDLILLHLFALLHRLKNAPEPQAAKLARLISEAFITDMDRNLREMGIGDAGVKRRIGNMSEALYGRLQAYEAGLSDDAALGDAISRNLYGGKAHESAIPAVVAYLRGLSANLSMQSIAQLAQGEITFL